MYHKSTTKGLCGPYTKDECATSAFTVVLLACSPVRSWGLFYISISDLRFGSAVTCCQLPSIISMPKSSSLNLCFNPHPYLQWIDFTGPKHFCTYSCWVPWRLSHGCFPSSLSTAVSVLNISSRSYSLYLALLLLLAYRACITNLFKQALHGSSEGGTQVLLTLWTLCLIKLMAMQSVSKECLLLDSPFVLRSCKLTSYLQSFRTYS